MKKLSVTLSHLREAFEQHADIWAHELEICNRIEKRKWKTKEVGTEMVVDVHQLGLDFGAEFAFNVLRFSDPKPLADQIARFICIDIAAAGLRTHPHMASLFPEKWEETLYGFIARGGDLVEMEGWCSVIQENFRYGDVSRRLSSRIVAVVCGRQDTPDIEEGGLDGLIDAVDDLAWLLMRADARYTSASRIATLAHGMEARWQNGTRLDFEFADEIDEAMEKLEEELIAEHEPRALGVAWASWVRHTRGEIIRPVAPIPAEQG